MRAAVLFARADSIYKTMPGLDVFDIDRDARTYTGNLPIVAHPPCRAWGQLRHFAKPRHDEKDLARFAVQQIREKGGVLEHPVNSTLWQDQNLPWGPDVDEHGGFTVVVDQFWFGHRARKRTALYIVGCHRSDLPAMPIVLGEPEYVVAPGQGLRSGMPGYRKQLSKKRREATPPDFAVWLCAVAEKCRRAL